MTSPEGTTGTVRYRGTGASTLAQWLRNGLLVALAVVAVTLIGAIPLSTLYLSVREFGVFGAGLWYGLAVAVAFLVELRVLRNPVDGGWVRLAIGCMIAPLVVLAVAAIACLPLYLVLRLF